MKVSDHRYDLRDKSQGKVCLKSLKSSKSRYMACATKCIINSVLFITICAKQFLLFLFY